MNDEQTQQLTMLLRAGNYLPVALRAVGLSQHTFAGWLQRGRAGEQPFARFLEQIEEARSKGHAQLVSIIAKAAREGDWHAAQWLLERQWPQQWGAVSVRLRAEAPIEPEVTPAAPDDPFAEVDELAAHRRQRTG